MPWINPLRPPNVNEVLRRDEELRRDLHRDPAYYDDSLPGPKRKKKIIRNLANFIAGRSGKKDG